MNMTVVLPTYDRHELLRKAVRSVLEQTSPPEEVIVVDNGFVRVDVSLLPEDVQVVRIRAGAGVSAARNAGVELANGEYVAFLDDDDRWEPTYLEHVIAAIRSHPAPPDVIIGCKHREVDGIVSPYKMIASVDGLRESLLYMNPGVGGQNLTVRREFHLRIGGFRPRLRASEDRAYLIDAIDHGADVRLVPEAIAVKVMHPGEQLTDGKHRIRNVLRFSWIYWQSMGRMQRIDNTRKVLNALRDMTYRRLLQRIRR
jgi:glycosyltransferase involved in cell wall biosynthesis